MLPCIHHRLLVQNIPRFPEASFQRLFHKFCGQN
jgi:hypothetical protein